MVTKPLLSPPCPTHNSQKFRIHVKSLQLKTPMINLELAMCSASMVGVNTFQLASCLPCCVLCFSQNVFPENKPVFYFRYLTILVPCHLVFPRLVSDFLDKFSFKQRSKLGGCRRKKRREGNILRLVTFVKGSLSSLLETLKYSRFCLLCWGDRKEVVLP